MQTIEASDLAGLTADEIVEIVRKREALITIETLERARQAVAVVAAPIVGTPYSAGSRLFVAPIEAMIDQHRSHTLRRD